MWLLNTSSLQLNYVVDSKDDTLAYAILSHTWGDDELTYQDITSGSGKDKKGHTKVLQTCRQALKDGWKYCWIDTCCINKESSAELSEAINSMWRWYCDAQVCYAHLADLDGACPELEDGDEDDPSNDKRRQSGRTEVGDWHALFGQSEWFRRGWTLQELLAPRSLNFYSKTWTFVGSKVNLTRTLSSISGIDVSALESRESIPDFVIARKMSWAAGRQTVRIEDRAYSLLGIFGVNMPLLYGEGDRAFIRLQEELVRTSTDQSVFVWQPNQGEDRLQSTDLLFATSPDQFCNGKRIVRWESDMADAHYRLTNKGIKFHDIFFVETERSYLGVLNCRFEDDLRGPLALRLYRQDLNPGRLKRWESAGDNDFWIGRTAGDDDGEHDQGYNSLLSCGRLVVYSGFNAEKQYDRGITMLRYGPMLRAIYRHAGIVSPKVWLTEGDSSLDAFELIATYPPGAWNRGTGVMCLPLSMYASKSTAGSATVQFKSSSKILSIAFRAPVFDRTHMSAEHHMETKFTIAISPTPDLQETRKMLDSRSPGGEAKARDVDGSLFSVSVELVEILSDMVYRIEVSMRSITRP